MRKAFYVKQRDITDCGAACLVSVAAYYQYDISLSRIRQYAGTDTRGTNVQGLIEAATKIGLQARGARGNTESLYKIPLPAITHFILPNGLHHYVVLYRVSRKAVMLMDPAEGRPVKMKMADFAGRWSGVIILLLPGHDFKKGTEKASNLQRCWQLVSLHKGSLVQALAGALIYTILGLSLSVYVQKIVDIVLVEANLRLLNLLSVIMIVLLFLQLFIGGFKTMLGLQVGQQIDAHLILGYYKHLLQLPQRFFDTMRVGEIISRVNDAVKIRSFINDIALNIIVNACIVLLSLLLMFIYSPRLCLLMLAIFPFYIIIYAISNRVNRKWQRELMENGAALETQLVESLQASGTIRRFGLETYANEKTENRFTILLRSVYATGIRYICTATAVECITRVVTIMVLWRGSYYVIGQELTPGTLLSFYTLTGYFTGPAASLIHANKGVQEALIAADRLFEIIDLDTETDAKDKIVLAAGIPGDIIFRDICFRYGSRAMVFEGLNLCIKKGSCTAVVGESGSGKSTLLALLQNLYPVRSGKILIGQLDIQYISNSSLRTLIAVVPQQTDLFAGSIIENISIGDHEPDLERVFFLSAMLGINDFADEMPAGYHTPLTERGVNLSGGQRQRIAIARAMYRNPEILMLDEATASLDTISEQKVQAALAWFNQQGKTVIIIAHRLSTIRHCDQILVLFRGKLAEQGVHEELLGQNGHYAAMWRYHSTSLPV